MTRRTIPELRVALLAIADQIDEVVPSWCLTDEIRQIVDELVRRSPARKRAPTTHQPLTGRERDEVKQFALDHPNMHLADIASRFNINPGRVSEAIGGKR